MRVEGEGMEGKKKTYAEISILLHHHSDGSVGRRTPRRDVVSSVLAPWGSGRGGFLIESCFSLLLSFTNLEYITVVTIEKFLFFFFSFLSFPRTI